MNTVIKVIGTVIVAVGLMYMIRPEFLRKIIRFFAVGRRIYFSAIIRFILAVVFVLGARQCGVTWVILLFAVIFLLSGLLVFMLGLENVRTILEWYYQQPAMLLRVVAAIVLAVGLIIVYAA